MTDKATETKPARKPSSNILLWLLTWIAIIAVASYTIWQKETTDKTESAHMQAIVETMEAQEKVITTLTEVAQTHDEQFQQVAEHSNQMVATIRTISQQVNPDDQTWRMLKIQTYIDQAVVQASVMDDPASAAQLLNAAAYQVQQINDPSLMPLSNAIAKDVKALSESTQVDKTSLIVALNIVIQEVPNMPQKVHGPKAKNEDKTSEDEKNNWQDDLKTSWHEIKSLIQVRRHDEPITPHISSDEHYLINENLQLILQQANFAALQNKQVLYTQQLKTAIDWLNKYYDTNDNRVTDTIAFLQKLSEQSIAPNIPEQLHTLDAWNTYLTSMEAQANPAPEAIKPPPPESEPAPLPTPEEAAPEPASESEAP